MDRYITISKHSLVLVMLFVVQFVRMPYSQLFSYVKYLFIIVMGLYILKYIRLLKSTKYMSINVWLVLFSIIVCSSSYINRTLVYNTNIFLTSIVFCVSLIESFFCLEIMIQTVSPAIVVKTIKNCALVEIVVIDILYFCMFDFLYIKGNDYIIGSKFSIAYAHLFAFVMYIVYTMYIKRKKIIKCSILFLFSCFMCIKVDCMTGLVGLILILLMCFIINKSEFFNRTIINPYFLLTVIVLCFLYIFVADLILNNPYINNFIHTYMDEEGTMESRNKIYKLSLLALSKRPLIGYGYNSSYELGMAFGKFANTQNSVLEWIWQSGVFGTIIMITFVCSAFGKVKRNCGKLYIVLPFLSLFYVYILLGTVEITFNSVFFTLLAFMLYFSEKCDKKNIQK